jgi:hypothetical protein
MSLDSMVLAGRLLLGSFYLISGLNWFFGYLPLPSMHMPLDTQLKHQIIMEMIKTGWMFQFAKTAEIAAGLALLTNRFVPGMLALSAPVAFITFMLDAMILDDVLGWFAGSLSTAQLSASLYDMVVGGLCVLLLHVWLMLCYFDAYRPMLVWKTAPRHVESGTKREAAPRRDVLRTAFFALGILALALQAWNFYLFVGLIGGR